MIVVPAEDLYGGGSCMPNDLIFTSDQMGGEDTMDCRTRLILSVVTHMTFLAGRADFA
jgi:hypothetical protein